MTSIKRCDICLEEENKVTNLLCENMHTDYICKQCAINLKTCPFCRRELNKSNIFIFKEMTEKYQIYLYNKPGINENIKLELLKKNPELNRYENDYLFKFGKYKNKWVSSIKDQNYLKWAINNLKLNEKNKKIFQRFID